MRSLVSCAVVLLLASAAVAQTMQPTARAGPFLQQIQSHFAAWDADKDSRLSFSEIELACTDPSVKGPAAVAAATMRNLMKLRGLTLDEYSAALTETENGKANGYEADFEKAEKKLAEMNRDVFPNGVPKGGQLAQGRLGDCFLLAGVGTMAQVQPQRLKKFVDELPDGKTVVTFGNGQKVVLPLPTDAEVLIGSTTRGDGVWSLVLEKAIGERYRLRQKGDKFATPFSIIGVGGTPNTPLAMMTGHKVSREGCEMFQKPGFDEAGKEKRLDEIRVALESAFKENRLVIGGTGPVTHRKITETEKNAGSISVPGLYYNHSYGVLAYDRQTDVVTFWNPMSNLVKPKGPAGLEFGYPTSYGHFDCPLKDAVMWFGSFSIEMSDKLDETAEK